MEIKGNAAVVTGGAGGLGEAAARLLHANGARVVLFDRDEERCQALARALGDGAVAICGDATSPQDTAAAIELAATLGPLRVLVACAGGSARSTRILSRDGTPHDLGLFAEALNLNVVSTFNSLRLAAQAMARLAPERDGERGVVVMTSSIAAYEGQIGQIAYGAAKAAIAGMTVIAARDLAATGIRVNTIAPGIMDTRAWDAAPARLRETLEAKVPFPRRFGAPDEFAATVRYLIETCYVNGHVLRLDGGIRFDPK